MDDTVCDVCQEPRPGAALSEAVDKWQREPVSFVSSTGVLDTPHHRCNACTFLNELDDTVCDVCQEPRPGAALSEASEEEPEDDASERSEHSFNHAIKPHLDTGSGGDDTEWSESSYQSESEDEEHAPKRRRVGE